MFHRLLAISATTTAAGLALLVGAGTAAYAETVDMYSQPGTAESSSEEGTGAMSSSVSVEGLGGAPQEHPGTVERDHYGAVGSFLEVEGGATYTVTVNLDNAVALESASGTATARGFVEVDLSDCCFAGETSPLGGREVELPSSATDVEVSIDVYVPRDTQLTVNVLLHAFASAHVDTTDTASVEASATGTTIDITRVDDLAPTPPADDEEPRKKKCVLFLCF